MATDHTIDIAEDGTVTTVGPSKLDSPKVRACVLSKIIAAMDNPEVSLVEVSKLISREIAESLLKQQLAMEDPSQNHMVKSYNDFIKNLRALGENLKETEELSKKDVLNFDGPKFKHYLERMTGLYKRAIKDAGVDQATELIIMKQFTDLMATNEEVIRFEVQQVETSN